MKDVVATFGLGEVWAVAFLANGMMNHNWRVDTSTGTYAVKQLRDVQPDEARRQHDTLDQLATAGLPVPRVIRTSEGDSVVEVDGLPYAASAWVSGTFRDGTTLSLAECRDLGALLGRVHHELADVRPAVPERIQLRFCDPAATLVDVERYLAMIAAKDQPDAFDRIAVARLHEERELLSRFGHRRPDAELGAGGWIHGDFHHLNVLWEAGRVSAVLDWDRLKVAPRGYEVARAAELLFWNGTSLDLERIAAFTGGYREAAPISTLDLEEGLRARWWNLLCGLWPLDLHYDRDDRTCDHLFDLRCTRLVWWCANEDALRAAATVR